jgi:hypothetical protein
MADFFFAPGATEGNFRAGGRNWGLNWEGGKMTQRAIEAARLAIDATNELGADKARANHEWRNETGQTEASVFVRPAHLALDEQGMWGTWGVRDLDREPIRINNPRNPEYGAYEGRALTMKDVALLLEFGFHLRNPDGSLGGYRQYPWLYPAWDETRGLLPGLMRMYYGMLGSSFRYRLVTERGGLGQILSTAQVFGTPPDAWAEG